MFKKTAAALLITLLVAGNLPLQAVAGTAGTKTGQMDTLSRVARVKPVERRKSNELVRCNEVNFLAMCATIPGMWAYLQLKMKD